MSTGRPRVTVRLESEILEALQRHAPRRPRGEEDGGVSLLIRNLIHERFQASPPPPDFRPGKVLDNVRLAVGTSKEYWPYLKHLPDFVLQHDLCVDDVVSQYFLLDGAHPASLTIWEDPPPDDVPYAVLSYLDGFQEGGGFTGCWYAAERLFIPSDDGVPNFEVVGDTHLIRRYDMREGLDYGLT